MTFHGDRVNGLLIASQNVKNGSTDPALPYSLLTLNALWITNVFYDF